MKIRVKPPIQKVRITKVTEGINKVKAKNELEKKAL